MEMTIFKNLDDSQKISIITASESCEAAAGDTLIQKDEEQAALYLLLKGTLQVLDDNEVIAEIGPGEFVGELGFWAKQCRSATVRAKTPCSYLKIQRELLEKTGVGAEALIQLDKNIVEIFTHRLKTTNHAYSGSLKKQLDIEKQKNLFGSTFIIISLIMSMSSLVSYYIKESPDFLTHSLPFVWGYLLCVATPSFLYYAYKKIPLSAMGLNRNNLKMTIRDTIVIGLLLSATILTLPWLCQRLNLNIGLTSFSPARIFIMCSYFFHSIIQEILARGILLQSLMNFFGEKKKWIALVIASFFFSIIHLYLGIIAVITTFIAGLIFGAIYIRHRNIYGVSILHAILGSLAFGVGLLN